MLRKAERGDRLDELKKIGVSADSATRQHNPPATGVGMRDAPKPECAHRIAENRHSQCGAIFTLVEDLSLQQSAVGATYHHR